MTVAELFGALRSYGLRTSGTKSVLEDRLAQHLAWRQKVQGLDLAALPVPHLKALVRESGLNVTARRTKPELMRWLAVVSSREPGKPSGLPRPLYAVIWVHPITRKESLYGISTTRTGTARLVAAARRQLDEIPFEGHLRVTVESVASEQEALARWPLPEENAETRRLHDLRNLATYSRVPTLRGGNADEVARQQALAHRALEAYREHHRA